jgi:hypothetical protein
MIVGTAVPAGAASGDPADSGGASDIVAALNNTDPDLLGSAALVDSSSGQSIEVSATSDDTTVTIPTSAEDGLTITPSGEDAIEVALPFAGGASDAESLGDAAIGYDNGNGSSTAVVVRDDGSVQVSTVIDGTFSPTRYQYDFTLPDDTVAVEVGGSVLFVQGNSLILGLAPAWAKDAAGRDVPTWYEVSGTSVTQVVAHGSEFMYPIVADPWMGLNIFDNIALGTPYQGQAVVNLDLSGWGWTLWVGAIFMMGGSAVFDMTAWSEAWAKGGSIRTALDKPSMRQQFACHTHTLGAPFAGQWNLEKARPNRTNGDWLWGVAVHHCNWNTAGPY